jgi:hypothetical protein
MATVEQWEYFSETVSADANVEPQRSFLKNRWPSWLPPIYAVQSLIPRMNALGQEGWELVHMEPIPGLGANGDVGYPLSGQVTMAGWVYSHAYFCVYKRRIPQAGG